MASCDSHSATVTFIGRTASKGEGSASPLRGNRWPGLFHQAPNAVFDTDQDPGALVEAVMIGRGHVVDAVRADDVLQAFEGIAQRLPELRGAWLRLLQGDGGRGIEQEIAIVAVSREGIAAALAKR